MIQFPLLYIDPGTGSMLFSILLGAAATLYFLARTLIIKLKVLLSGGKVVRDRTFKNIAIYSEGKQYWNVFKQILDELEMRETEAAFFTSSKDDPVFAAGYKNIKPEFIGDGNIAYARLNFLEANILLMTTPGLDVYQLKKTKRVAHYSHILHMPSDPGTYRLFSLDYFDSVLVSGSYQADEIRFLEKKRGLPEKEIVVAGCTYLDVYAEKIKPLLESVPKDKPFTVLVSPSWGESGLLKKYGEKLLNPLVATGRQIIIRPHPQSKKSEAETLDALAEKYKNCANVEWDFESENIASLSRADIMVSDFSGVIFDYVFLCGKPVLYTGAAMDLRPYDASDLEEEMWQFKTLRKIGKELREEDFENIGELIDKIAASGTAKEAIEQARDEAWQHRGEAGKKVAEFLISHQGTKDTKE